MSDNPQKVEVFQPRDVGQFYDEENDEFTDELAHEIRDVTAGMVEADDIDLEMFGRVWSLVGAEDRLGSELTDQEILNQVFEEWQNAPQTNTSEVFYEQNQRRIATSLSVGDIVRVNGTAYLCESFGWAEVEEVSC